jgi:DnaJ-class molecular chaperone
MKRAEELLRVRGKGIPVQDSRGDLIIQLEVALPHKLSGKAKKAVEDLQIEGL